MSSTRSCRARRLPLASLALVVAVAAVTAPAVLLMLAPALALVALLLAGRTPGERLLLRLHARRRRGRRAATALPVRRFAALFVRWNERMSASALAMRPPPPSTLRIG